MPHRSVTIANEFLRQPGAAERLTQMHLQKLTYFSHGWNWAINQAPLVADDVEAWTFGPVYRDLYNHTKFFGSNPIGRLISPDDSDVARFFGNGTRSQPAYAAPLADRERQVIRQVWHRYGGLSGIRLSELTHQPDTPWYEAYRRGKNSRLDQEIIRKHYAGLAARASGAHPAA